MKITKSTIFSVLVLCGAAAFAGASATSGYFTVDTAKFVIDDVTSPYCGGAYNSGRKATFLSGVRCQIDFEVKIDTPGTRQLSHFLVNGSKVDSKIGFRMNVGGLNPGDKLEVVAVDKDGAKTDPFRVNIDIASSRPWTDGGNHFAAAKNERRGVVVYYLESFNAFFWMDGIQQMYEIAGEEFDFGIPTPSFKVASTFDSESAQYTVGAGIGAAWSGIEDKIPKVKQFFEGIKKQNMCKFAGAQVSASLSGGTVCQWDPDSLRWRDAGGTLEISAEGKVDLISFRVPQSLYLVYVRAGLDAQGSISASKINGEWSGEIGFDPLLGGHGIVGAGLQDALCVEGSATCGLFLKGQFPANPRYLKELGFDVKASWKTVFLGVERPRGIWEKTFMWYPGDRMMSMRDGDAKTLSSPSPEKTGRDGLKLVRRDYGNWHSGKSLSSPSASQLGDGYPYPAPSLAAGERAVLVYLRDNTARSAINRTEIVWRAGERGVYGESQPIWDDGTADFMPQVSQNGSGLTVATWTNAKSEYGDTDFDSLFSGMEIAVAVLDNATGEWTAQNLTDDSALDMTPKVAVADDGSAVVAWVKNRTNDAIGSNEMPSSVYVSFYRDGVWTAPQEVATAGLLYSFDLGYNGSTATVAYAKDKDGDATTEADGEVWCTVLNRENTPAAILLSTEGANALRPFTWYCDSVLRTVFLQNGALMRSDNLDGATTVSATATVPADYSLLKNADGSALVVWRSGKEGFAGDETKSLLLDKSGSCGNKPVVIIEGGDSFARNATGGIALDGSFHLAYESVAVSFDSEGVVEYGDVRLKSAYRDAAVDIGFGDGALAFDGDVAAGETVNVIATASNYGTADACGVKVELWRGPDGASDRSLVGSTIVDIAALSSVTLSFPWAVEQGLDEIVFVAKADSPEALNDVDRTNNSLEWRPEFRAFGLSLCNAVCAHTSDTVRRIGAKVYNGGIAPYPAGATVNFWRGEVGATLLGTSTLGEIVSGESGAFEVFCDWNLTSTPMTSVVERVVIELNEGDVSSFVSVDVEGRVWNVVFDSQGGQMAESSLKVMKGCPLGILPTPGKDGSRFAGWYTMPDAGEEFTAETVVSSDYTLYAHWEKFTCRMVQPAVATSENDTAVVAVMGGNDDAASSVKVYLTWNTASAADVDLKRGNVGSYPSGLTATSPVSEEEFVVSTTSIKFPLTLSWEKGEIGEKVITIPLNTDKAVEDDEFFTLQLAEAVGMELGGERVCTVTIHDPGYDELAAKVDADTATKSEKSVWDKLQKAKAPYIRGLADPADGGKVTGSALCAAGKKVTLKATANKDFAFLGWAEAQAASVFVATTPSLAIDRSAKPAANSKTSTTITNVEENATFYAVFKSNPSVTMAVAATDEAGSEPTGKGVGKYVAGTITGAGKYAPGKKVALKATANRGYVFSGWRDNEGAIVSRDANWSFAMSEADVALTAEFVTAAEATEYGIELKVGDEWAEDAFFADATVRCGIAVNWPIGVDALSAATVKVSGLPAGLKLVQDKSTREYRVEGVPTAASKTDKAGEPLPSVVRFKVATADKSTRTFEKRIAVKSLPYWAYGTFNGVVSYPSEPANTSMEVSYVRGMVAMTVAANGKIGGKFALDGTNYTFSATGYTDYSFVEVDDMDASLVVEAEARSGKTVLPIVLYGCRNNLSLSDGIQEVAAANSVFAGSTGECGGCSIAIWRDPWKDAGNASTLLSWVGAYTYATRDGGMLSLVVDDKGGVKVSGTLGTGRKVSLAGVLHPYFVDIYAAPTKSDAAYYERIYLSNWHEEAMPGGGTAFRDAGALIFIQSLDGIGYGTVTANPKYGQVADGKTITLTAKAAKDAVFVMWIVVYRDHGREVFYTPTLKLVSSGEDVAVAAVFSSKQSEIQD